MKPNGTRALGCALLSAYLCWGQVAQAAEEPLDKDIHETIMMLPVAARNLNGSLIEGEIPVTTFRPDGNGPFPLVVISHGRDTKTRATMKRVRYESAVRYFVRKGFAVAVPTRLGYSATASLGDPEENGWCANARYDIPMEASAAEIAATVARMQQEPWVDKNKVVLIGQSVGGISTVAAASQKIPGLITAINFAGGHGGNPESHPGVPCNDYAERKLYAQFGKTATVPMLWVYTQNDLYFNAQHSQDWAQVYNEAGGRADYRLLPAFKENGHHLFAEGNDIWQPLLDTWLKSFGFNKPGTLALPPASNFAAIDESEKVPYISAKSRGEGYAKFLTRDATHRAFALNAQGNWGWSDYSDDLLSRTLANCQRRSGLPCKLYAVNQNVVWQP